MSIALYINILFSRILRAYVMYVMSARRSVLLLTLGELARFPDSWDPMDESSDVAEVPLAPDSLEYKTVSSEFEKTIGNFQLSNINQVCFC